MENGKGSSTFAVIFSILLAFALLGAGLVVDTARPTTALLSSMTSDYTHSPYSADSLNKLAVATRDFTVLPHMAGDEAAETELAEKVLSAASIAEASNRAKGEKTFFIDFLTNTEDPRFAMYTLADISHSYALSEEAIHHLSDCNALINKAYIGYIVILIALAVCGSRLRHDPRSLANAFITAPSILLAVLAILGIWAMIDFSSLFSVFHALLFPQGNWIFEAGDLLICMYPQDFWVGMAAIWLAVSTTAAIICIAFGKHSRARQAEALHIDVER